MPKCVSYDTMTELEDELASSSRFAATEEQADDLAAIIKDVFQTRKALTKRGKTMRVRQVDSNEMIDLEDEIVAGTALTRDQRDDMLAVLAELRANRKALAAK